MCAVNEVLTFSIRALGALLLICACGEDEESVPRFRGFGGTTVKPGTPSIVARKQLQEGQQGGPGGGAKGGAEPDKLTLPTLLETDFIAGDKHRDPFQPYADVITGQRQMESAPQHDIKLKEYDVADLKLIAIITNIGDPRAMVQTPDGTGFVIRRGDFVGRADFVDQGGISGERIQLNWKVARIHGSGKEEERGVYLTRDDPTTQGGVDITRFLPLHPRQ